MENIDLNHGLEGAIRSLISILLASLVAFLATKAFDYWYAWRQKNRAPSRQEFEKLTLALNEFNKTLTKNTHNLDKISTDQRRIYWFLKAIAGEKWPDYFRKVREIEKLNKLTEGDL